MTPICDYLMKEVELTKEQMQKLSLYELTFDQLSDDPQTTDFISPISLQLSLGDLKQLLFNLQNRDPLIKDFLNNWYEPMLQLEETWGNNFFYAENTTLGELPEDYPEFRPYFRLTDADLSIYLWDAFDDLYYNEGEDKLSDHLDFFDLYARYNLNMLPGSLPYHRFPSRTEYPLPPSR